MRYIATALVSIIMTASISVGITHTVMQEDKRQAVELMEVEAFNDGFMDGSCNQGFDGFGHPCK